MKTLKMCTGCWRMRPDAEFLAKGAKCRKCRGELAKAWHRNNPEKSKALHRRRYAKRGPMPRHLRRKYNLKFCYDMTESQYEMMLQSQGGVCKICRKPPKGKRPLCVDHCHETGKVRGLLCDPCNAMLGRLDDDPAAFERVIAYLKQ